MLGLKREIDQVAKDKGLDSKEIIAALEEAMRQAAKRERGLETEIDARFNEELGEIELFEFREVVEEVTDKNAHISLNDAKAYDPDAEIGDEIGVKVDTSSFGRILAQTAKQVIIQRIREAERDTVYEEYKDRAHEIVNGIVRRFEKGAIIIDLGRAEAVIPPKEQVPRENYRPNDRIRAYVRRGEQEHQGIPDRAVARLARDAHEAVRAGGARDLRGDRRDQGRGARAGRPVEDRGGVARQRRRPGRRVRRHEGQPRAGGGAGAARRADRHRAVERGSRALRLLGAVARGRSRR